jgi:hypothetical protein
MEELVEAARVREVGQDRLTVDGGSDVEPGAALEEVACHRRAEADVVHALGDTTAGRRP